MNEELTNEDKVFSAWLNDAATSLKCVWITPKPEYITRLARMYFEERARPKVWDGAPEDAFQAQITWFTENGGFTGIKTYNRELPKTRARQIAENTYVDMEDFTHEDFIDAIESALIKYAEELEGNHERRTDKRSTGSDEEV